MLVRVAATLSSLNTKSISIYPAACVESPYFNCKNYVQVNYLHLLAKIGVDTAENEPLKVWRKFGIWRAKKSRENSLELEFEMRGQPDCQVGRQHLGAAEHSRRHAGNALHGEPRRRRLRNWNVQSRGFFRKEAGNFEQTQYWLFFGLSNRVPAIFHI